MGKGNGGRPRHRSRLIFCTWYIQNDAGGPGVSDRVCDGFGFGLDGWMDGWMDGVQRGKGEEEKGRSRANLRHHYKAFFFL